MIDENYQESLKVLFKGVFAQNRETHAKNLELPTVNGSRIPDPEAFLLVKPIMQIEPLATHYLRQAQAYQFVRKVLVQSFGEPALAELDLIGEHEDNSSVLDALKDMELIYLGAYATVCADLGIKPIEGLDNEVLNEGKLAITRLREYPAEDDDFSQDARMMAPLFFDVINQKTKVTVFMGWYVRNVTVSFEHPPKIKGLDEDIAVNFAKSEEKSVYPAVAEFYVDVIQDRAEVQKICDEYKTPARIIQALQANRATQK